MITNSYLIYDKGNVYGEIKSEDNTTSKPADEETISSNSTNEVNTTLPADSNTVLPQTNTPVASVFKHTLPDLKLTAKAATFKVKTKVKKYSVTLKASNNKAVKNVKLTIKINGKTYTAKTNSNGKATFKINKLSKKGKFTAKITFKGNKNYNAVTKTVKITVKK